MSASRPTVYVLAVGIALYGDDTLRLNFPDKDAKEFVDAFKKQEGKAFSQVTSKILTNSEAKLDSIRDGLRWLQSSVKPEDIGILFLSGHGFDDRRGFYHYLPQDASMDSPAEATLLYDELLEALTGIKGTAVLFLDTCHAGALFGRPGSPSMDVESIVNQLSRASTGIIVYASSTGTQLSLEAPLGGMVRLQNR